MSLILDTHIVLWWLAGDPALPGDIRIRLDREPGVWVSAASLWEIAIKQPIGKLAGPLDLPERIRDCGFAELRIGSAHAIAAGRLPLLHRDPFDRMLVAQAQCENMTLVTADPKCRQYDVPVLAV